MALSQIHLGSGFLGAARRHHLGELARLARAGVGKPVGNRLRSDAFARAKRHRGAGDQCLAQGSRSQANRIPKVGEASSGTVFQPLLRFQTQQVGIRESDGRIHCPAHRAESVLANQGCGRTGLGGRSDRGVVRRHFRRARTGGRAEIERSGINDAGGRVGFRQRLTHGPGGKVRSRHARCRGRTSGSCSRRSSSAQGSPSARSTRPG